MGTQVTKPIFISNLADSQQESRLREPLSTSLASLGSINYLSGPVSVVLVSAASPAASGTRDYEQPTVDSSTASSGSREVLSEPVSTKYVRTRLRDLADRCHRPEYPPLETLQSALNVARSFLDVATPSPSVMLGDDRSVDLVWNTANWHVEVEIGSFASYVWALNRGTGEAVWGDLMEHRDLLADLLADSHSSTPQ